MALTGRACLEEYGIDVGGRRGGNLGLEEIRGIEVRDSAKERLDEVRTDC